MTASIRSEDVQEIIVICELSKNEPPPEGAIPSGHRHKGFSVWEQLPVFTTFDIDVVHVEVVCTLVVFPDCDRFISDVVVDAPLQAVGFHLDLTKDKEEKSRC